MNNKLIKALLFALGLFISPFIVIGVLGGIYILIQFIGGSSISEGFHVLIQFFEKLKPYLLYITFGPVILIGIIGILRKRQSRHKI